MRLLLVAFLLLFSSCIVSTDEFYKLQRQVVQLQSELKASKSEIYTETGEIKTTTERLDDLHKNLRKSFADTNTRIDELEIKLNKSRGDIDKITSDLTNFQRGLTAQSANLNNFYLATNKEISSIKTDLREIKSNYSILFSNISSLYYDVRLLSLKSNQPKEEINPEKKEKLYNDALEQYNKKNHNEAIELFERFVILYPQDTLTPNALYWIGETYYSQKKFSEALSYFHRVIVDFSNSKKVPSALLKEIFCLDELGMEKEANGARAEIMARFPFSEEVKILRERDKNRKKKK